VVVQVEVGFLVDQEVVEEEQVVLENPNQELIVILPHL
jgi:hypothetical protein